MTDKTSVADWSTTASDNDNVGGVELAENKMRPKDVNNAIRTVMAQVKDAVGGVISAPFATKALAEAYTPKAAPDFIQTAGYSAAGDGGGALYKKVDTEPGHAGKFSITLSDGVTVVWYEIAETGSIRPQMFGVEMNASTDQATAFQAMLDAGFEEIYVSDSVRLDSDVTCDHNICLRGPGKLDFTNGNGQMSMAGSATQISDLSANVPKRSRTLSLVSATAVSAFSLLLLYNPTDYSWSGHRASYREGEYVRSHSVSGNDVTIYGKTYDAYTAANMDVYLINGIRVFIEGITVLPNQVNSKAAIKVDYGDGVRISGVKGWGGLYSIIELQRCFDIHAEAPTVMNNSPVVGDEYGLVFSNCQNFTVTGPGFNATRHTIAIGGGDYVGCVPTREGVINGCILGNAYDTGAGDAHGCSDHITYIGCSFRNQAVLGGRNQKWIACTFLGDSTAAGPALFGSEIVGGFYEFIDPVIISDGSGVNGYIQLIAYGPGNTPTGVEGLRDNLDVIVSNALFDVAGGVSGKCIQVDSRANTKKATVTVRGVRVARATTMQAVAFVRDSTGAALPSDGIVVDDITGPNGMALLVNDSSIANVPLRLMDQTVSETVACTSGSRQATGGGVGFRYPYPKIPTFMAGGVRSTDGAAKSTWGGQYLAPWGYSATTTIGRVAAAAIDGNFTSTENVVLSGTFGIREI